MLDSRVLQDDLATLVSFFSKSNSNSLDRRKRSCVSFSRIVMAHYAFTPVLCVVQLQANAVKQANAPSEGSLRPSW